MREAPRKINKATEVAAAFRGKSAFDPAVRVALAVPAAQRSSSCFGYIDYPIETIYSNNIRPICQQQISHFSRVPLRRYGVHLPLPDRRDRVRQKEPR